MALARVLQIIALLLYFKGIHGQLNNLINPTVGQNNIKQSFQSTSSVKSVKDNLFQNENLGRITNFNSQNQINSQLSSIPQSTLSLSQQVPLQQSQIISQLINQQQQPAKISDLQQPRLYQTQSSFIQQPVSQQTSVNQQPCNFLDTSSFVPVTNTANINYQQKGSTPVVQPLPLQVSQSIPVTKSYVSSCSSVSPVNPCGGQRTDVVPNLSGNYVVPLNTLPFSMSEGKIISSIPIPYKTVLTTSNPITLGNNVVMPYQNHAYRIYEKPLDNFSGIALGDDGGFDFDNFLSLLLSILQSPKKSSKSQGSSNTPFTPYKMNQGSKSSSLKELLPVILNIIKDRRDGCRCHSGCGCNCKNRNQMGFENQCNGGYLNKKDFSLQSKEQIFNNDESAEETPRFTREHQNDTKTEDNSEVSVETNENDGTDYDDNSSEEEED